MTRPKLASGQRAGRPIWVAAGITAIGLCLAGCGSAAATENFDALLAAAEREQAAGQSAACVSDYTRLLSKEPTLVKGYSGRAACYVAEGNTAAAAQDYSEAIRLSPVDPQLYLSRAAANEQLGNNSAAAADYVKVSTLPANNPYSIVQAAQGLSAMRFYSDALLAVDRGKTAFPYYWALFMQGADIEVALGNDQQALKDFDNALHYATGTDIAVVMTDRGKFYLRRLQYSLAMADFNGAIAKDSQNWAPYEGRSQARLAVGDRAGAEADLSSAIRIYQGLNSSNTWPLAALFEERGRIYVQEGRRGSAASDFGSALDTLTPTGPADWRSRLQVELAAAQG